jgi:hypothetical protein
MLDRNDKGFVLSLVSLGSHGSLQEPFRHIQAAGKVGGGQLLMATLIMCVLGNSMTGLELLYQGLNLL